MSRSVRTISLWFFAALAALAYDFSDLQPDGYITDYANVIDARTEQALERYCRAVEASTGAQIAVLTIPTLHGEPIEDVANLIFRKWGVGKKETDEGLLLLLAIEDRRSRLEVGYGLEPVIPDGYAGSLLRRMRPALKQQRYGEAVTVAVQTLGERIAQAKGVSIREPLPQTRRVRPEAGFPVGPMLFALFVLFLILGGRRRSMRYHRRRGVGLDGLLTGLLLGNLFGRGMGGFHGRSSGGFGGFDSFDSFGGFGGGDSGGGGASSSW